MNVFVNDTNNDDITRFPIPTLDLYIHNTIDTLRYLTAGPEIGMLQAVQKVHFEAQILISNLGKDTIRLQQSVSVHLFGSQRLFTT
jgi:hypothetical protein